MKPLENVVEIRNLDNGGYINSNKKERNNNNSLNHVTVGIQNRMLMMNPFIYGFFFVSLFHFLQLFLVGDIYKHNERERTSFVLLSEKKLAKDLRLKTKENENSNRV